MKVKPIMKTKSRDNVDAEALYIIKDRVTGQTGEVMHAANDAAIVRTFDRMFSAGKNNFLIRDLEIFRFAELMRVDGDPFPVIYNIDVPVCVLRGSDYFEELEGSDHE